MHCSYLFNDEAGIAQHAQAAISGGVLIQLMLFLLSWDVSFADWTTVYYSIAVFLYSNINIYIYLYNISTISQYIYISTIL